MLESHGDVNRIFDLVPNQVDRAIVVLYYLWGMDAKEIAHCFDITEIIVETRLNIARTYIQTNYE